MRDVLQFASRIVLWWDLVSFALSVDRKLKKLNIEANGEGYRYSSCVTFRSPRRVVQSADGEEQNAGHSRLLRGSDKSARVYDSPLLHGECD